MPSDNFSFDSIFALSLSIFVQDPTQENVTILLTPWISTVTGQLQSLAITTACADELPGLIVRTSYPIERRQPAVEQAAIGHPVALRILRSQLDNELRQVNAVIGEQLRAAVDAATQLVTDAAGGQLAAGSHPFARRHLEELARHHSAPPVPVTQASRERHYRTALRDIDASLAALQEIEFRLPTCQLTDGISTPESAIRFNASR